MTKENELQQTNVCVLSDLIPLSKFNDYYPQISVGAIRQYRFYAKKYNFQNVVKKLGNRLYISISAFNTWVEEQNKEIV